jgi:ferrochelatase
MKKKVAVVLFNLGGPSSLDEVEGFLFNLFNDKAIIDLPKFFRYWLAKLISFSRREKAKNIYKEIGGKSPILELTKAQAKALEKQLISDGIQAKTYVAMRYSSPRAKEVAMQVAAGDFDDIILLPLYPQFSTTTSESSIEEFKELVKGKLTSKLKTICCYPTEESFIKAHVVLINKELEKIEDKSNLRILFSAHGLPEKIIKKGDPYQFQVEKTVELIAGFLPQEIEKIICYQSKVGPMKWIGPSTEHEIIKAGEEQKDLLIVPIAFVSEHSETLVELDIEYKELAKEAGVNSYFRVPALGTEEVFIKSLANMVKTALNRKLLVSSSSGVRICDKDFCKCLMGAE